MMEFFFDKVSGLQVALLSKDSSQYKRFLERIFGTDFLQNTSERLFLNNEQLIF